jgi:hypothetical protein
MADQWIVEFANRIAQHQPGRLLALLAATWLPAVPFLLLLWLAVAAIRRRQAPTVSLLALAAVGALASFGLHQLVDHLYFRPRPYWALPAVHAIGARRGDSSFFSLEAAIAAALACGLLLAARRWGWWRSRPRCWLAWGSSPPTPTTRSTCSWVSPSGRRAPRPCCPCATACNAWLAGCCARRSRPAARGGGSCAWASSRWSCWSGWAAGWSPASRTTACGSRSTGPTRALAAACPPTRGCTGRPPSTPWPRAAGDPPARGCTGAGHLRQLRVRRRRPHRAQGP